jgi:signal transduction histidine kinase/CheY-like chemotaxis protein
MGSLIRSFDWSKTPIGPVEQWSSTLRTMVSFLLANRFPLLLWWGPRYISIYNDAYRPILGTKHPAALGQPVSEVWSEIWSVLKPLIDTPFEGGPATWMEDIELHINRHGFFEESHFTVAYSPVPDETATRGIGGVLATVHEITEKVVGERRIVILRDLGSRASHAKTAEDACTIAAAVLSNHAKDVPFALLYLIDPKGGEVRLAGAAGIGRGEALSPLQMPTDASAAPWPVAEVLQRQEIVVVENLARRLPDVPLGPWDEPPHSAVLVPLHSNRPGELAGFVVAGVSSLLRLDHLYRSFFELMAAQIATIIANAVAYQEERRRAEALAEIDRAKTTFFSNISHEFRTPLTLMLGPLEEALRTPVDQSGQVHENLIHENLTLIHRNGLRLLRLVNMLLDFARIEAGRVQASYEPVDLANFTTDLASEFRGATDKAGLALRVDCPPLGEPVWVDCEMWEKIVLNLLSNAIKFTLRGEIVVRLRRENDMAVLSVEDTGIGIPAHELPMIFNRFHRVEGAEGRTHEGSGIGLALVQELSKLHGGTVTVDSVAGAGTTFRVAIPLGSGHLPADRLRAERRQVSTALGAQPYVEEALRWVSGGSADSRTEGAIEPELLYDSVVDANGEGERPTVLLADDNADIREYISRLLAPYYRVRAVADGAAALAAMRAARPDLVLSDVMMPRLDGFGLVREIRSDPLLADVPVVLLSARAGEDASIEGLQKGADDYVVKPFSARELLARVGTNLKMAQLRQSLEKRIAADLQAMTILRTHGGLCVRAGVAADQCLNETLDAAIALTGAAKGVLQLFDKDSNALTIAAQRGFERPLLEFFKYVRDGAAASASAMQSGALVIVEDIMDSDIFAGQAAQKVVAEAGVRAIIAMPLLSSEGDVLGTISTHFAKPHRPSERELHFLDLLARQTADYLERNRSVELQTVLLRELQHRSSNLLSVIQAIAHSSLAGDRSLPEARTAFEARLQALARANRQLTRSSHMGADLGEIVRMELAPFAGQAKVEGPDVTLGPHHAQNFSLAVHELATNAAKYGALSLKSGRVEVSWSVVNEGGSRVLLFRWVEHHGPPVTPPSRQGFGTSLLKTVFPDISLDYAIAGFGCKIKTPISGEASPQ